MKFLKTSLSILYGLALGYLVFFARRRRHIDERLLNVVPVKYTILSYYSIDTTSSKDLFNFYSNLVGNILLFIPIPFILAYSTSFKSTRSLIISTAFLSFSIEAIQYLFKIGVADIDDIILNTTGAVIGIIIMKSFRKLGHISAFFSMT